MLKIYVCGPTVYNHPHIGNLRPIITFDIMLKAYRALGKKFTFIHNITDVDDKIIKRAIESKKTEKEISEFYYKEYIELLQMFEVDTITHICKVTENMDIINEFIDKLYKSKNAYLDQKNNVWFDVKKNKKHYGEVSNQQLDKMIFEETDRDKKYEADFALWKKTTEGIKFSSNFGEGRPGWHTECVALITKFFGEEGVDIHGGGMDLTFPHHENENIQYRALFKKPLAKKWLRCGQLNLDGEKMSKSLGNIIYVDDFVKKYGATTLKLVFTNTKITANINITNELIENMKKIEYKYQKTIFRMMTLFKNKEYEKGKQTKQVTEMLTSIFEADFSRFNYLINEELKQFNKTKSLENAQNIFSVLRVIHNELTIETRYKTALSKFDEWNCFMEKKDYENADKIRQFLIENNFY